MKKLIYPISVIGFAALISWAVFSPIRKREDWKVKNLPPGYCIVTDGEGHWSPKDIQRNYVSVVYETDSHRRAALNAWSIYEYETNIVAEQIPSVRRNWLDCDQTNKLISLARYQAGPAAISNAIPSFIDLYDKVPEWNSLTSHAAEVVMKLFRTNGSNLDGLNSLGSAHIIQFGASPDRLQIFRMNPTNGWTPTNLMIETPLRPAVIGYETHWQITFKEAK